MFDDSDRRLRVQRITTTPLTDAPGRGGVENSPAPVGSASSPPTTDTQAGTGGVANTPPFNGAFGSPQATNDAAQAGGEVHYSNNTDSASISVTRASDARPQVGTLERFEVDSNDLKVLERQRAELEKLKASLAKKASELESRAAELK